MSRKTVVHLKVTKVQQLSKMLNSLFYSLAKSWCLWNKHSIVKIIIWNNLAGNIFWTVPQIKCKCCKIFVVWVCPQNLDFVKYLTSMIDGCNLLFLTSHAMSMTNKRKEHVCLNQLEMSVFSRSNMIDDLLLLTCIIMLDTEHYRWHFIDTLHSLYVVSSVQCRLIWGTRNHWKQSKPATFVT